MTASCRHAKRNMKFCMLGNSGHGLTVLREMDRRPDLRLSGFCPGYDGEDISGFQQEVLVRRNLPVTLYSSYEAMLEAENPDLIVIDGMFCDHAAMAARALQKNIHVFADKPLATTEADFRMLQAAQMRSKARLFAMMTMRYEDSYYTARSLVKSGAIGKIRMLNGQKSYRLGKRPRFYQDRALFGGLTLWVSIHMVDLIQWITGKQGVSVFSMQDAHQNRSNGDLEMLSLCSFELEDHILASVHSDYYRPAAAPSHGDDRLRIVGTDGILEILDGRLTLIDAQGQREVPLQPAPDLFADCLRRIEERDFSDHIDGMYSTYLCLKARESADSGHAADLSGFSPLQDFTNRQDIV